MSKNRKLALIESFLKTLDELYEQEESAENIAQKLEIVKQLVKIYEN